jgi:hypothetical protein
MACEVGLDAMYDKVCRKSVRLQRSRGTGRVSVTEAAVEQPADRSLYPLHSAYLRSAISPMIAIFKALEVGGGGVLHRV